MQNFTLWLGIGFNHIIDRQGFDHILFITALCSTYSFSDWKKVFLLLTSFTIGHSITLALSIFNLVNISSVFIEFLIPITIISTAFTNIVVRNRLIQKTYPIYFMASLFGFIHGMGFSYLLKSLLGKQQNIVGPLFSFNLGLELGQMLIVLLVLLIFLLLETFLKIKKNTLNIFVSSIILGISFLMAVQRFPTLIS